MAAEFPPFQFQLLLALREAPKGKWARGVLPPANEDVFNLIVGLHFFEDAVDASTTGFEVEYRVGGRSFVYTTPTELAFGSSCEQLDDSQDERRASTIGCFVGMLRCGW